MMRFNPKIKYSNDEVDISKRLIKYSQKIYVNGDYLPIAVFYSEKRIESFILDSDDVRIFAKLFEIDNGNVIGVSGNWVFDDLRNKGFSFKILERNNDCFIL